MENKTSDKYYLLRKRCLGVLGIVAFCINLFTLNGEIAAADFGTDQSTPHRVICRHADHGHRGIVTECYPSYEVAASVRNYHMQIARGHVAVTQQCRSEWSMSSGALFQDLIGPAQQNNSFTFSAY